MRARSAMAIEEHGVGARRVRARRGAVARAARRHRPGLRRAALSGTDGAERAPPDDDTFSRRFRSARTGYGAPAAGGPAQVRAAVPPHPERDLLWFIAQYAPELEPWERDIFLAVREESFYFYPVFACQIMNEGWASYWHARLLREADFLPQSAYVDAIKCHSDVVRPTAQRRERRARRHNPYHLGFSIWEKIVEEQGARARAQDHVRGRRLRVRPQPPDQRARDRAEAVPLQGTGQRHADGAGDGPRRAARGAARPKYGFGAPTVAAIARARRRQARAACTTTRPTVAGSIPSAVRGCSITWSRSGGGRSCSRASTARAARCSSPRTPPRLPRRTL